MREPRWVPRVVIEAAHLDQLREHGGLSGLRDEKAVESALARARQKWNYDPDSDLATLAAAYAFGLAKAHPFNDGNKRIAFLAMAIFLGLNNKEVNASEGDVVQVMVALADGSLKEGELATWVRARLARLTL
ncbi:MAG: type II toxin-antitoxin system death-on-curing family toxin [Gemmatimonadales bacterium]